MKVSKAVRLFIAYKQSMGWEFTPIARFLGTFAQFAGDVHLSSLTVAQVSEFIGTPTLSAFGRYARLRRFFIHWKAHDWLVTTVTFLRDGPDTMPFVLRIYYPPFLEPKWLSSGPVHYARPLSELADVHCMLFAFAQSFASARDRRHGRSPLRRMWLDDSEPSLPRWVQQSQS